MEGLLEILNATIKWTKLEIFNISFSPEEILTDEI